MTATRATDVERLVEGPDEPQVPPALGRIVMLYYGWFFSGGITLTGLALLLLGDSAGGRRALYASAALFGFQVVMETLRYLRPRSTWWAGSSVPSGYSLYSPSR